MARHVKPWVGASDASMPPPRVRLRIFLAFGGKCQLTGREITPQDRWALDHRVALCNGGKNDEANLWPVLEEAHKAKTREDVAEKVAVAGRAKSHLGIKAAGRSGLEGRTRAEKQAARDRKTADAGKLALPPRRRLYADAPRQSPLQIMRTS